MSKSLMISGIAGSNIVSPYMAIRSVEPKIASVIQAVLGIFCSEVDSSCLSALSLSFGFAITNSLIHYRHTFCAEFFLLGLIITFLNHLSDIAFLSIGATESLPKA